MSIARSNTSDEERRLHQGVPSMAADIVTFSLDEVTDAMRKNSSDMRRFALISQAIDVIVFLLGCAKPCRLLIPTNKHT